jgi:general secretion pathway protein J
MAAASARRRVIADTMSEFRRQGGFTLLESLVAMVVLGMLLVGLTQGVRSGLALWHAQTRRVAEIAELDTAARLLRQLLSALPPPPSYSTAPEGEKLPDTADYEDHLSFVGDLPTGLGGVQRAEVMLALRHGRLVLLWTPHRHEKTTAPPPTPTETELVRNVARLQLAYWGRSSPDEPEAWQAQWDGPGLPQLIRLRLSFPSGDTRRWPDLIVAPQLWWP